MSEELKIVVAAHKPYWMPESIAYVPTWVGAALRPEGIPEGWERDDRGENISAKNPHYCELTALFWAWKNLGASYLGLAHYRRHFAEGSLGNKQGRVASPEFLLRILKEHPVILPVERNYFIETNYSQYVHAHHAEDLALTRQIIEEKCPEYLDAYDASMERTHGHRFNMFVMRRDLLDAYCAWLFDILFELERRLDISGYSDNDARVFGFVSERLLDPWIETNGVDYASLPVVNLESQHWVRKGASFLQRKFGHGKETPVQAAGTPIEGVYGSDGPLVSVVVPAYNLEDCIEHCFACLQAQTYANLDMVFVDDGSTDGTPQLLDEFATREPRARVFHAQNGGQSAARNYGITRATGELAVYLDGDDLFTPDAVETLVGAYQQGSADLVIGSARVITSYDALETSPQHTYRVLGTKDAQVTLLYGVPGVAPWCKLARTDFWQAHPFPEGHVYEDLRTMFFTVGDCERVGVVEGGLYGYMMRPGSTTSTRTISAQRLDDYIVAIEEVQRCFAGNDDPEIQQALTCRLAHEYTRVWRHLEAHRDEDPRYQQMMGEIVAFERAHFGEVLRDKRLARMPRMRAALLAGAPRLFTPVYHLAVQAAGKGLA